MNPYSSTAPTGRRLGLLHYLFMAALACVFHSLIWFWPQAQWAAHDPVRTLRMLYMLAVYPGIAFGWWLTQKLGQWQERGRRKLNRWEGIRN